VADACIARWLCACLLFWTALAGAHPIPESLVWIDATATGLQLTAQLPLRRLGFVFGLDNPLGQQTVLARDDDALAAYLLRHVGVRSGAASWQVLRPRIAMTGSGSAAALEAVFDVRAPVKGLHHLELVYDIITDEVRTHHVRVFLRRGWQAGLIGQPPLLLGELKHGRTTLPVTLAPPAATGLLSLFAGGVRHIARGADQLVFLLMLVLAVALLPRNAAVRRLAWAIAAFTLGHAAAMAVGSAAWFAVPLSTPLLEMAVALATALAALHAWRPLFARAEGWLALGCGTLHGLAGAGLAPWQQAQALLAFNLAFNLGIVTMQALAVAVALPPLLVLARRTPVWFGRLRLVLAAAGGMLALAWSAMQLAPAGIDVSAWLERDTAPMMIMAVLWAVFLSALGAAQWRAWRAGRTPRPVARDAPPVRDDPPA